MAATQPKLVFTLGVLCAINVMNFFDRQILPAVQERVRKEWNLSDGDLGLLGSAFIVLYAFVGLPLGRLADRWSRKYLLALGVALWSLMTAGSGLATSFGFLFWMRLGVGIGEASCAPAATSLLGDLFPIQQRARAMAVFMLGLPLGLALSFPVSAFLSERWGWQSAFLAAAVPGFLLALAACFIEDPPRHGPEHGPAADVGFWRVASRLLRMPTMWWIILSGALHNFNMYALGTFLSSLLQRHHGLSSTAAGQISGLSYGIGALGIFLAGRMSDRAFETSPRGRLNVAWRASALAVPFLIAALLAPAGEVFWCALALLPGCFLLYFYYGTVYATIQDLIEPRLRGMAMAVYFFGMYLLGALYGPWATGKISDWFARRAAAQEGLDLVSEAARATGLRQAMGIVPILCFLLALVLFAASRTIPGDRRQEPASPSGA